MKKEKYQNIIIGSLCFLIAASICVQYRSVHTYVTKGEAAVQSMSENKLRDRVLKEQENYDNLYSKLQDVQEQLENLRKNSAASSSEAQKLEKELSELNIVLGYTDVKGKGLIVTLRDSSVKDNDNFSDNVVHDLDILEVVNELFNAGAEAVSVNGQRIISTSAITCSGNVITVNNEKVAVPFVIKAIGAPENLYETMTRPRGYLEMLEDLYNINVKVERVEKENGIVVPKYAGTRQYEYLQVVE
ncbi:MAG: DUF881 domain-containing protein [Clostridia bacterium]|jgi:uncharacterized protein YlxW (UPF0749 family)|nr:DUF881 domain-containing protein [Clostridia bacterium]